MIRELDLDSLACFEAAATYLNFRSAASAVSLSPAAFSDRIRRLEDVMGSRLFDRTTRRVALTRAGLRLLPEARKCLEAARRCGEVVRDDAISAPFELTLGTRFELGLSWLVPSLAKMEARRPDRMVHLYFGTGDELLSALEGGRVDGIISSSRLVSDGLDYATLHREKYVFVAAPQLVMGQPLLGPDDAPRHRLLDISDSLPLFRYFLDAWQGSDVWSFSSRHYLGTIGAIRSRTLEGYGVSVLPEYFVGPDLKSGKLVRLAPDVVLEQDAFRLVWRRGHRLVSELHALSDELRLYPLQ